MPTRRDTIALSAAALCAPALASRAAKARPAFPPVEPYTAACLQTRVLPTQTRSGEVLADNLAANVEHVAQTIERCADNTGARLLVFSEFVLQLPQGPQTAGQWVNGAITIPGPETDRLAQAASKAGVYVALNAVEYIPAFPGRYFLAGVLLGPTGNIELNYRKLYGLTSKTRPSDILPEWLDRFGAQSLFPVADTPLGRIAVTVGSDLMWPELARSFVFNGAEVLACCFASPNNTPSLVAASSEQPTIGPQPNLQVMARRARAYENMAYMLSANLGPVGADGVAGDMQASEIIDFRGNPLAISKDGSEQAVTALVDIEQLRTARCTPGAANMLLQLQTPLHSDAYENARITGTGAFSTVPVVSGDEHDDVAKADIRRLIDGGMLVPPADYTR